MLILHLLQKYTFKFYPLFLNYKSLCYYIILYEHKSKNRLDKS